jgi:hypothetical protein
VTGPVLHMRVASAPWWTALINSQERPQTSLGIAMYAALERALHDRRSAIHQQTFGWYERQRGLVASDQARAARIAVNTFAPTLKPGPRERGNG